MLLTALIKTEEKLVSAFSRIFYPPIIFPLIIVLLLKARQTDIDTALIPSGLSEPKALQLLGPILKLVGALILAAIRLTFRNVPTEWADNHVRTIIKSDLESTVEQDVIIGNMRVLMKEQLINELQSYLDWFEAIIGFGILALGFAVDLLAIFYDQPVYTLFLIYVLIGVVFVAFLVRVNILPKYTRWAQGKITQKSSVRHRPRGPWS